MPLRSTIPAIPAIRAGLRAAAGRSVERAAGYVADRAQYLAPVDTGDLKRSIHVTIDEEPGRLFAIVWAPAKGNLNLSRKYGADEGY